LSLCLTINLFFNQLILTKMKKTALFKPFLAIMLLTVFISCKKNEYTIEDKLVTGTLNYVQTGFVPLEVDPVTQQPLKARISFEGSGIISDMGELNYEYSFTFDFVAGQGSEFDVTYTGANASDSFTGNGTSQMIGNMVFTVTENFSDGKGKFKKIKGGGETLVTLVPDGTSGSGEATWTVTY
jgi:hypothetical protein